MGSKRKEDPVRWPFLNRSPPIRSGQPPSSRRRVHLPVCPSTFEMVIGETQRTLTPTQNSLHADTTRPISCACWGHRHWPLTGYNWLDIKSINLAIKCLLIYRSEHNTLWPDDRLSIDTKSYSEILFYIQVLDANQSSDCPWRLNPLKYIKF